MVQKWGAIRESGMRGGFEARLRRFDGEYRWFLFEGEPLRDESGNIVKWYGSSTDIEDRKRAEEELQLANQRLQKAFDEIKKSEDRLRLVVDSIPTLVWRAGADGVPDFLNQPALDYTGLSLHQVETGWPRAFHPDDKKGMLVKWSAIRASGMPGELEARLRRFDGVYRWFLFRAEPLRDELGNIVKWYGSSTDIEDRKLAEVALRESEQRFRDYVETASDWLWEMGPDHRHRGIISTSDRLNAVGLAPSRMTGAARWEIATDTESEPEKWRLHRALLDARRPFRDFVYRIVGEDGSPAYVRTSGKPYFDASGNFLGYRGTGTDVTAAIRADHAEEELRNAQAELAHVMRVRTLGEMTVSIAHEVNQPIAATVINAQAGLRFLGAQAVDLNEIRQIFNDIVQDGNRAGEVIRRIRDLVKKAPPRRDRWEINGAIREVVQLTHGEAMENCVSVQTELADGLPLVQGDRVQMQQVILNLVINAIQAMSGLRAGARELLIGAGKAESGGVLVTVRDSGPGLAPATLERVFESFYTTKPSGMGLGLSICRSIVEAHGGRLWVSANVPRGAIFQFTVPADQGVKPR
jgi:PAS domain S-box-containing protein